MGTDRVSAIINGEELRLTTCKQPAQKLKTDQSKLTHCCHT